MKISKIAEFIDAKLVGDDIDIKAINSLDMAKEDELSYCDSAKNAKFISSSKAGCIIVKKEFSYLVNTNALIHQNPHLAFAKLSKIFAKPLFKQNLYSTSKEAKIMPNAYVSKSATIGEGSLIMPGVFIGEDVKIGKECIIYPNVVIYNCTTIGDSCIIHANSTIGSDGFGYAHTELGEHVKIYHNGVVVLEDHVEVGANTTIDRAVFGKTIIKKGTKIDNLVQIGHNCELGENCIIVSQTGLAGSTKLGRNVIMGGQSGSGGHLEIGDFAQIAAKAGVTKNLKGSKQYGGHPIYELSEWLKLNAKISRAFRNKNKSD